MNRKTSKPVSFSFSVHKKRHHVWGVGCAVCCVACVWHVHGACGVCVVWCGVFKGVFHCVSGFKGVCVLVFTLSSPSPSPSPPPSTPPSPHLFHTLSTACTILVVTTNTGKDFRHSGHGMLVFPRCLSFTPQKKCEGRLKPAPVRLLCWPVWALLALFLGRRL